VWRASQPPDYDLTVDGSSYALEATTLVDGESVTAGFSQAALAKEIEYATQQNGTLNGQYLLHFPEGELQGFRRVRKLVVQRAVAWIGTNPSPSDSTILYTEGEEDGIVAIDALKVRLARGADSPRGVIFSKMAGTKWQEGLARDAVALVNSWAAEKKAKLDKEGESRPRVLALREDDVWAALVDYRSEFSKSGVAHGFHEIFIVGTMDVFTLLGRW